jgi:hypothetical protein
LKINLLLQMTKLKIYLISSNRSIQTYERL